MDVNDILVLLDNEIIQDGIVSITIGIGVSGFIFMILRRSHKEESK